MEMRRALKVILTEKVSISHSHIVTFTLEYPKVLFIREKPDM